MGLFKKKRCLIAPEVRVVDHRVVVYKVEAPDAEDAQYQVEASSERDEDFEHFESDFSEWYVDSVREVSE